MKLEGGFWFLVPGSWFHRGTDSPAEQPETGNLKLETPEQRLGHLRDARLVIEEAVGDEGVNIHRRIEQAMEERLEFFGADVRGIGRCGAGAIFIVSVSDEGLPIDAPDLVDERFDADGRAGGFEGLRGEAL